MRELDPKSPQHPPACAVVGAGVSARCWPRRSRAGARAAARRADPGGGGGRAAARAGRQDRRGRAHDARRGRCSATARARPASTSSAGARAFSLHPLMSVPDRQRARRAARRGRGGGRHLASARWRSRTRWPSGSACIATRVGPRIASPTTRPARSPRTSSSRWRPARSGWRRRRASPARSSPRSCSPPRDQWAELGPEAALTGPIARGDEGDGRAPPRRDRRAHPRAAAGLDRARRGHPGRGG